MKNKALKILFLYNSIFVLGESMLGPLYAIYVVEFIDGVTAVSVSWAAFLISTSIFTLLVAKKGDGVKEEEELMMFGYLIRAISWIMMIFISSLWALVLVQLLLGFGSALGGPSFSAIFAKHLDKNKFVKEYSGWFLIRNLSSAAGILIGGVIVGKFGFEALFIIMASLSLVSFFGILLKPRKLL